MEVQVASLRVFVSHSHKDNNWCDSFVAELQQSGLDVWYDRAGLYVGAQWIPGIERELQVRETFLIVLTPDSWASPWVQNELSLALGQQKQIIGVLCKPTSVSGFITNYQLLDATRLDARQAAQLVASSLSGAKSISSPSTSLPQTPQVASRIDISGEWEAEHIRDFLLLLSQVGTNVTGTGELRLGIWIARLSVSGSIDGANVKLTATPLEKFFVFSYLELNLIFLPPGKLRGHEILYERGGLFNKNKISMRGTNSRSFVRPNQ
jgi:hypothetical protein